jgi:hypothetical protein
LLTAVGNDQVGISFSTSAPKKASTHNIRRVKRANVRVRWCWASSPQQVPTDLLPRQLCRHRADHRRRVGEPACTEQILAGEWHGAEQRAITQCHVVWPNMHNGTGAKSCSTSTSAPTNGMIHAPLA